MNLNDVSLPVATKAAMRNVIETELRKSKVRRTRRKIGVAVLALSLIGAGATAGAAYYASQQPAKTLAIITCYSSADLSQGPAATVQKELSGPFAGANPNFADPIGECLDFWKAGMVTNSDRPFTGEPLDASTPLPELQACVREDSVAVIPGPDGTCGALKLPDWNGQ